MIPRRYVIAGLGILLAIILAVVLRPNDDGKVETTQPAASVDTGESAESESEAESEPQGGEERGGAAEAQEEAELTEKRLEALAEARARGEFGRRIAPTRNAAPGWVGSRVMSSTSDDWEPAVAADPKAPYVYLLTTRYGTRQCGDRCPKPWIPLKVSTDGGTTWGPRASALPMHGRHLAARSDHRGRAQDRRRIRSLPELRPQLVVDGIHEIHRPWRDMEQPGPRLRRCGLDGQARADHEPVREARLFLLERAERRRPLRRHLA